MVGKLHLNCYRISNSFFQNDTHWVVICFISCIVTHEIIKKTHTKLIDFLDAIVRITKIMIMYFMQNNFFYGCVFVGNSSKEAFC